MMCCPLPDDWEPLKPKDTGRVKVIFMPTRDKLLSIAYQRVLYESRRERNAIAHPKLTQEQLQAKANEIVDAALRAAGW